MGESAITVLFVLGSLQVIVFVAALAFAVWVVVKGPKKYERCRACSKGITDNGYAVIYLGPGFCSECAIDLMRFARDGK